MQLAFLVIACSMGGFAQCEPTTLPVQCPSQRLSPADGEVLSTIPTRHDLDNGIFVAGAPSLRRVYTFQFDGSSWVEQPMLEPPNPDDSPLFGYSVALNDGWLFVGDVARNTVYIYRRVSGIWEYRQEFIEIGSFGSSLASQGDHFVGGTRFDLHAYQLIDGIWQKIQTIDVPFVFGSVGSMDIEGDVLAAGMPGRSSVQIYRFDGSTWRSADLVSAWEFGGQWVDLDGNRLIASGISSQCESGLYLDRESSAFIFRFDGSTWQEEAVLKSLGPSIGAPFFLDHQTAVLSREIHTFVDGAWTPTRRMGTSVTAVSENWLYGAGHIYTNPGLANSAPCSHCDCNDNGMIDVCDVETHVSPDCDSNQIPDECDPDCNANDVPDACDIAVGFSEDCDYNQRPDECDIDRNEDGTPDVCEGCGIITSPNGLRVSLEAVAVNGKLIDATHCVTAEPGDIVDLDVKLAGWGDSVTGLVAFEAYVDNQWGADSGRLGTALPLGWYPALNGGRCGTAIECPTGMDCVQRFCRGPVWERLAGAFVDLTRPDYVFETVFLAEVSNDEPTYRCIGVTNSESAVPDDGTPKYVGTIRYRLSADACGPFLFRLGGLYNGQESLSLVVDYDDGIEITTDVPLVIQTPDCDCNANGIPDHDDVSAGAVDCDHNDVPDECESDCNGSQITDACDLAACTGDPACGDCNANDIPDECDIAEGRSADEDGDGEPDECRAAIPAASAWGVLALILALACLGKIAFHRMTAGVASNQHLGR